MSFGIIAWHIDLHKQQELGPSEPLCNILATPSVHLPGHTFTSQHKPSSFHPRTPLKSPSWCLGKTPGQCLRNVGLNRACPGHCPKSLSMYTAFAPVVFILLIASPQAVNAPCQWHHFHRGPGQVKECLPWERWTWQQIFYRADFRTPYELWMFHFFHIHYTTSFIDIPLGRNGIYFCNVNLLRFLFNL